MHALVIEDIAVIAIAMEELLEELGYTSVDIANSKEEAARLATERCPDLIVADYRLADGTGVDAVKEICRSYGHIPVVYTAALVDEVLAEQPGATVIEKPVGIEVLRAGIRSLGALEISSTEEKTRFTLTMPVHGNE